MGRLYIQQQEYDVSLVAHYSFPATSSWFMMKDNDVAANKILFIIGVAAPGSDHNNAPVGSLYLDITNFTFHMKDATGANWSTFTQTS